MLMRTTSNKLLFLMAAGLGSSLAHAEPPIAPRNATGSAIPQALPAATPKDAANPAINKPDEPGTDCVSNITPQDERAAINAGVKVGKNCLPQADAFTRAGEAASYLAHYYQRYTPYANEIRAIDKGGGLKDYQEMIRGCVTGQPSCGEKEKAQVLKAMVQYNFGKEIRAQVLEGRTRAELMKSIDLGAKGWSELGVRAPKILTKYNALKTGTLRKNTFRLDPRDVRVDDFDKLTQEQRQKLGANYLTHFNQFFDAYSKTTSTHSRWHYVAAKSSALGAENVYRAEWNGSNQDERLGKTLINRNRHDTDQRSQNQQSVNEIVKVFKDDLRKERVARNLPQLDDPKKVDRVNVEPYRVAVNDVGLGLMRDKDDKGEWMKPKDVASAIVITINKAIHETEEGATKKNSPDARMPSSATGASRPRITPTVSVDVEKFDKFLDAIWPADVAKP